MKTTDPICAIATAPGMGAIAVIRVSGEKCIECCDAIFRPVKKNPRLIQGEANHVYLGWLMDENEQIDQVLITIFRAPASYTGEDTLEISCHGSEYIQKRILELLIKQGIRLAKPGEFTLRAFLNGKMDLSQAEAVADLIASHSKTSHNLALDHMRGGFSKKIKELRAQLLHFASMIELELDFSEEDVEFANRDELSRLLSVLGTEVENLIQSFKLGNVLKNGIPVAIVGKPNVGKSTLLNALLNEERAIVSDIPGTTRDTIEDTFTIQGITFRFIDTAGLRDTYDEIENFGIERTYQKIEQASIILYVVDINETGVEEILEDLNDFHEHINNPSKKFIVVANKTDLLSESPRKFRDLIDLETIFISAKRKDNVNLIIDTLMKSVNIQTVSDQTLVSNARHYEALSNTLNSIHHIEESLANQLPGDLLAVDLRAALHHLGSITGEISNDEILGNIFANFCIGK